MSKSVLLLVLLGTLVGPLATAQTMSPVETVVRLLDAIENEDELTIEQLTAPNTTFLRATPDDLIELAFDEWRSWPTILVPDDTDPRGYRIYTTNNEEIASVQSYFALAVDREYVSCGKSAYTLTRHSDGWLVVAAKDEVLEGFCESLAPLCILGGGDCKTRIWEVSD
ncbi:MAG: hypothetical protein AAGF33_05655 [Pseudomonadota bacterium]